MNTPLRTCPADFLQTGRFAGHDAFEAAQSEGYPRLPELRWPEGIRTACSHQAPLLNARRDSVSTGPWDSGTSSAPLSPSSSSKSRSSSNVTTAQDQADGRRAVQPRTTSICLLDTTPGQLDTQGPPAILRSTTHCLSWIPRRIS